MGIDPPCLGFPVSHNRNHSRTLTSPFVRINRAISAIDRDPTERCLFWASCLCAEIVHEHKLKPTRIIDLIASNAYPAFYKTLGKGGIRRTISNAFRHVEEKILTTGELK